ncbi:MAG: DEAD/DEAH box helicase [Rhodospirillales bacterium]|nr:MAG: DEAD/DEAH box helicase [Rhodospirillales bacterium]
MTAFSDLGLAEPILRAVAAEGYTRSTPIQSEAIPAILAGRDVLGTAQTGTGKTAAFVLPILHRLTARSDRAPRRSCHVLIITPTRELASQIGANIRAYGRYTKPTFAVVIGGARPGPQIQALAGGVDIVIATPGRLLDHVGTGAMRLDAVHTVVLDEADQMLDLGFMPAIRRIMAKVPTPRQTTLFSATMPKPIRMLADDFLNDPVEIALAPTARPVDRIQQQVMHVDHARKRGVLVDVLKGADVGRSIVFTRTKRGADRVSAHLQAAGLSAAAIHGNKSQSQRERTLAAFRGTGVQILVATDIAARGIDVDDISHVVNFELPNVPEAYVHRIGRTARAGASGAAISLCDRDERGLLADIERLIGRTLATTSGSDCSIPSIRPIAPAAVAARPVGAGVTSASEGPERKKARRPGASRRPNPRPSKPAGGPAGGGESADAGLGRVLTGSGQGPRGRRRGRASA